MKPIVNRKTKKEKKKINERHDKEKHKIEGISSNISIIPINVNKLNSTVALDGVKKLSICGL